MSDKLYLDLHSFQGPFDLLLHLIKEMEVDIHDIPIVEITDQYIDFVQHMYPLDLDILGDYLVMAATLIEIKTKLLLPIESHSTELELEDPRGNLVQHLLLYQQFQTVATDLMELEAQRALEYTREAADLSAYQAFIPLKEDAIHKEHLAYAFQQALLQAHNRMPKTKNIQTDSLTVEEQVDYIEHYFKKQPRRTRVEFTQLLKQRTRSELITTFMAMLELVSRKCIHFKQERRMGPIMLEWVGGY